MVPLTKQKPPMEIAAVSTTAGDSDAAVFALGWYGSSHEKGHGKGKNRKKGKETERESLDSYSIPPTGC